MQSLKAQTLFLMKKRSIDSSAVGMDEQGNIHIDLTGQPWSIEPYEDYAFVEARSTEPATWREALNLLRRSVLDNRL